MALSHSVRALLLLKSLIKEVIDNLEIDIEKLKFVSSSTIDDDNNESIFMATSPRMTPTSKHIAVNYHWFSQHAEKEFVILEDRVRKSEGTYFHQRFTRSNILRIRNLLCGW